ncbi:MAG: exo-alpha-sialidase [Opitutales bacterium]|nr:exo-alpha-sialidase [Opitutales bacterium]
MPEAKQHPHYAGDETANVDYHHGMLRPVVGASHFQVLRANRSRFEHADGYGWTYNHAPMLAYWRDRFWLQYLSNPSGEHVPPGHTLLTTSEDGTAWDFPREVFPFYRIEPGVHPVPEGVRMAEPAYAVMHQRSGFYTAPDGRLLTLGFYGVCTTTMDYPNIGDGIGRVVREIHADGSFGPVYFLRYNRHRGWDETNTSFPSYRTSEDAGFVEACDALLADKLATLQWWEEDRSEDGFYAVAGGKALSYYHLDGGRVVGLWKHSLVALSEDDGKTWTTPRREPSFVMAGGKVWGQRTPDGRYAMLYNPSTDNVHRWPLAVVTSDDGIRYDHLLLVNGKVAVRRYQGGHKDPGMNYVRGIEEGHGEPPGDAFWVACSMGKEDIWVSRIPVPVTGAVAEHVDDSFNRFAPGRIVPGWNTHCGKWTTVEVVARKIGNLLRLCDEDRAETAQAERVFPESRAVEIAFSVLPAQTSGGCLHIEVTDPRGLPAALLIFHEDGRVWARDGCVMRPLCPYRSGQGHPVRLRVDAAAQRYGLTVENEGEWDGFFLFRPVRTVSRICFRTGPVPDDPSLTLQTTRLPHEDELIFTSIPGADDPAPTAVFELGYLQTRDLRANASAKEGGTP